MIEFKSNIVEEKRVRRVATGKSPRNQENQPSILLGKGWLSSLNIICTKNCGSTVFRPARCQGRVYDAERLRGLARLPVFLSDQPAGCIWLSDMSFEEGKKEKKKDRASDLCRSYAIREQKVQKISA